MAHVQQIRFCESIKKRFPYYFKDKRVLDVGSLDINGSNRYLFENCEYIGVDLGAGKNVDVVCPVHLYNSEPFDVIISTECFEHDKFYKESLKKIVELLKPNGLFLFTCATTGRIEHGTEMTTKYNSPFTNDYYKNLTESDIRKAININKYFRKYKFSIGFSSKDLYFYGIKKII